MAKKQLITTNELKGTRVLGGKRGKRRIGKIRRFVFHPTEKRVVGFIVKRPDLLWMFKRKDMFVSIEGYDLVDGRIVIRSESGSTDNAAYKALGINPDACVLWIGLPLMTKDSTSYGTVGNVIFNQTTGQVKSVESDSGVTANALLGKREVPADMILGFKKGMGVALSLSDEQAGEETEPERGAILVSEEIKELATEGGVAEKAGAATAVAVDKASKTKDAVSEKASVAAKKTGEAVNKGAYATGKQIGKTKGMFSSFKEEYNKARNEDE
ncbi:MAG: PRC-barrel domain-containing protein [Raoultibacter sp.]|jgi:uncharacterized protein YrrD